jgi:hypothetical protein
MTALLAVSTPCRAPQGRGVQPHARHWRIDCEALIWLHHVIHGIGLAASACVTQRGCSRVATHAAADLIAPCGGSSRVQ